ncbi:MAG: prepilin-type N-terminal cleavage/methylation domain-containing protein [Victivallales bacterium]|nr:prepilin-type N-terminal cleavage/methylation domain-containing protein [Victivallales bacterium]
MKRAFTLVELLATIAIIAILAGILLPVTNGAIKKAQAAKAKAEITTLVNAIRQYESQYGVLPMKSTAAELVASADYEKFIKMLQAEGDPATEWGDYKDCNKRKIKFLDVVNNTPGDYPDPWDGKYAIYLDHDGNGKIGTDASASIAALPDAKPLFGTIVIYSLGPDGLDWTSTKKGQGKDNVFSIPVLWDKEAEQFVITH